MHVGRVLSPASHGLGQQCGSRQKRNRCFMNAIDFRKTATRLGFNVQSAMKVSQIRANPLIHAAVIGSELHKAGTLISGSSCKSRHDAKHQPANPPSYRFNQRCNNKSDSKINKSTYPFESEEVQGNLYILYFVEPHVTPLTWLQKTHNTDRIVSHEYYRQYYMNITKQHRSHRQSRTLQTVLHEYYETKHIASPVTNTTDNTT